MREPRVCVVGAANIDLIATVRRLPVLGETVYADSFQIDCGGKGSNQAVMAAKLGARVAMVAKLGRDVFGERVFKNYERHGIDTSCVSWDGERPSGVASILVDAEGRNAIVYVPGANFGLAPADIGAARHAITEADVVVCQREIRLEVTAEALRTAKDAGRAVTIFNPAPAGDVSRELMAVCDVVVPNEIEVEAITGINVATIEDAERAGRRLLDAGASAAVITLGARGAVVADREGTAHVPAVAVTAADSTGAGDAFIGTLAYCLGRGDSLRRASGYANVAAALSVTKGGTQSSFPTRAEVEDLVGRLGVDAAYRFRADHGEGNEQNTGGTVP